MNDKLTNNYVSNVANLRTRGSALRLSTKLNDEQVAVELDQWNTLLGINYPGEGYYDSAPQMEVVGDAWVMKFPLIADDNFWESFCSPEFQLMGQDSENIVLKSYTFDPGKLLAV